MTTKSPIHTYTDWTKTRLDEMDASVAVLKAKVAYLQSDARAQAEATIADMKTRRDKFAAWTQKEQDMNAQAWAATEAEREAEWASFEKAVDAYLDAAEGQAEATRKTFEARVAAQQKAWRETAEKFKDGAAKFQTDRKADVDAAVAKLEKDAATAGDQLKKLNAAGGKSWAALRTALTESRHTFEKAFDEAQAAFKDNQGHEEQS
ncbi:hypothetical protein IMCC20628_01584 [Hoeflea sp. IMCC20628]|uniref:hypothetical protein n=1 Tax=Hoeflea sp. IMCC20628 TaxID=1620421 RepID=UPI00063A92C9|nr:hypothetical protein [Hoeflea sp. IMCC20628]AKI00300.1 hypothetical protein IMCC20628_01584 [Hoeflea sp. IMCC20628]